MSFWCPFLYSQSSIIFSLSSWESLYFVLNFLLSFLQLLKQNLSDRIDGFWILAVASHCCFVPPTRWYSVWKHFMVFLVFNWVSKCNFSQVIFIGIDTILVWDHLSDYFWLLAVTAIMLWNDLLEVPVWISLKLANLLYHLLCSLWNGICMLPFLTYHAKLLNYRS